MIHYAKKIDELRNKGIFIVVALETEARNLQNIKYTGLGKINAAIKTTELIKELSPQKIINYGTCGSINKNLSGLVKCTTFVQHDIDCRPLGVDKGITAFDTIQKICHGRKGYTCASGDCFVTDATGVHADVVDMKAYAIAKACLYNNVDFECYKYITDSANDSASSDWSENCHKGIESFLEEVVSKI